MNEKLSASENPSYEEVKAAEDERNIAELKNLGREYRDLERRFMGEYAEKEEQFAGTDEKQDRLSYTVTKYEDYVKHNRFLASLAARSVRGRYELAKIEEVSVDLQKVDESVEVKSGAMYAERLQGLKGAIGDSEREEVEKEGDLEKLSKTLSMVLAHVESQFSEASSEFEAAANDRARTRAHNNLIEHLNWMNEIAEKYGVRRFTCRDFLTSRDYNAIYDENGAMARTMKSDRAMVESYFEVAYRERIEVIRRKLGRTSMFGA